MSKFLHTVTLTGIDVNTNINDLLILVDKYRFVEFAILLSNNNKSNRYPPLSWICSLKEIQLPLACHLCGKLATDLAKDGDLFDNLMNTNDLYGMFNRVQMNVGKLISNVNLDDVKYATVRNDVKLILQTNDEYVHLANKLPETDFLFDLSGGTGVVPSMWPNVTSDNLGLAGGLNVTNLEDQLQIMQQRVGEHTIWIDVETGVRTDDWFDITKATKFLEISSQYVK